MLERERHRLILREVEERTVVAVADLLELLGASEATVRRDIAALGERGELRRVRGGAEAMQKRFRPHLVGTPLPLSREMRAGEKRRVAEAAAGLVRDGDSVVIGAGSTTFALAEFLRERELDVLTSSFALAAEFVAHGRSRVTLPGGTIYREQSVVLSPFGGEAPHFHGRLFLTSCYGLSARGGMMENDPLIVQSQLQLLGAAEEVVVLVDSAKLRQRSSMVVAPPGRIGTIVTDDGADASELEPFRARGIAVIVAGREAPGDGLAENAPWPAA